MCNSIEPVTDTNFVNMRALCAWVWQDVQNLSELDKDDSHSAKSLRLMAGDELTCSLILEQLSYYPDVAVRIAVAGNSATPADVLKRLAHDENVDVRFIVARNRLMDISVLTELEMDSNSCVADRAGTTLELVYGLDSSAKVIHLDFGGTRRSRFANAG